MRDFLRDKFTNQELYDWMIGQISATYFQSYQLAYDLAKQAERAYRFEVRDESMANDPTGFIRFGYWDSLKQGLLAGESLYVRPPAHGGRLPREEPPRARDHQAHLARPARPRGPGQPAGRAGVCFVVLPEALFDADYPGHYMRRIKSVSLTIPCEVGPYTSVNCTLTLVRYRIRLVSDPSPTDPAAFEDKVAAIESIVTSTGQGDAGLFETNLRDERFLPFEGAGAVSLWRIELPPDTNAFDTSALTDLILHLRYTARDGGQPLRDAARANLQARCGAGRAREPARPPGDGAPPRASAPPLQREGGLLRRVLSLQAPRSVGGRPDARRSTSRTTASRTTPRRRPSRSAAYASSCTCGPASGNPSGLQATLVDPGDTTPRCGRSPRIRRSPDCRP